MNLAELGAVVKKEAPLLGSIIASANPMAGLLINLIAVYFGAEPKDLDSIANTISTDSDAKAKLKQLEIEHQDLLLDTSTSDRANARAREETYVKLGQRDWILDIIAILFILFFFIICILNYFLAIKDDHVMIMLIGQISAGCGLILAYFFGSSNK